MPSAKQDQQALDFVASNPQDPRSAAIMQKLGVGSPDVQAWQFAAQKPDDEKSVQIKNKIFTKIAEARPADQEQGVSGVDRFAVKNLLDNEPKAQAEYFKKKGYETRLVGSEVQVKKPGETSFKVIDPQGIDLFDATDILSDIGEGIATAAATGAKALGAIGAPVTGGASLLATSALGGLATGGFEAGKQFVGKALGVRDDINESKILQQTALGATFPLIGSAGGKLMKAGGGGLGWVVSKVVGKPKASAKIIEEAAQAIGAKATPGQLYESQLVQKLESSLSQQTGKLGGMGLRKQISDNIKAVSETVESLLSLKGGKTAFESGKEVSENLIDEMAAKLKPAEAIYQKYEGIFARKAYKPVLDTVSKSIDDLATKLKFNDEALSSLSAVKTKLPEVKNLTDLKQFRSTVGSLIKQAENGEVKHALGEIYEGLTKARQDTLLDLAKTRGDEFFEVALGEMKQADQLYKAAFNDVAEIVGKPLYKLRGSPKRILQEFLDNTPEINVINKVLATNDPSRIAKVKQSFPRAFDTLRKAKVQEIFDKSAKNGVDLDPVTAAKMIQKLPPETASLLFGQDANLKIKALQTFMNTKPTLVGPSGTPGGNEFMNLFNVVRHIDSLGRSALQSFLTNPQLGKDSLSQVGRTLDSGFGRGSAQFFGNMFNENITSEENFGLRIPKRQGFGLPSQK